MVLHYTANESTGRDNGNQQSPGPDSKLTPKAERPENVLFKKKKTAELLQPQGCLEHSWEGLDRSNQKALIYITARRQEKQRKTAFGKCEECHR